MDNPNAIVRPLRKTVPPDRPWLATLLPKWQNNNERYSGFLVFAFELFGYSSGQEERLLKRELGVAGWVVDAVQNILRYKAGMYKMDRCHAICTYRDGSKTTWMQILILYFILVGEYGIYWEDQLLPAVKYIRYRGKTFDEAEKKTDTIKLYLGSQAIIDIFGNVKPTAKQIKYEGLRDNIKILLMPNGTILQPLGLNQGARGANVRGHRPDFDVADDVENKENTKTAAAREYNWDEIMAEQFGGLAEDGLFVMIFNYVHSLGVGPTVVKLSKQKETAWHVMVRTLSRTVIREEKGIVTETEESDWPQRFPMAYIRKLEQFFKFKADKFKLFRKEYYNEILSDDDYEIKFFEGSYERKEGHNWVLVQQPDGQMKRINCRIGVSADPAISEDKKSSDGVVSVTAFCSDMQRRVLDLNIRKFDNNDRFYDDTKKPAIIALTPDELSNVRKRGMVQEIVRFIIWYNADFYVIENAGQQLAWWNDVKAILKQLGRVLPGTPYHPKDEKVYKLRTGLMNRFSAGMYEIRSNIPYKTRIKHAVEVFPEELDIFDALHNCEQVGVIPKALNYSESMGVTFREDELKDTHKNNIAPALTNPIKYKDSVETYLLIG
jgi:hypothetical protein